MKQTQMKKGLTLIELLIVVITIAILSAIAILKIVQSTRDFTEKGCIANVEEINKQRALYEEDHGEWPSRIELVTNNPIYFPDGPPICDITKKPYASHHPHLHEDGIEH